MSDPVVPGILVERDPEESYPTREVGAIPYSESEILEEAYFKHGSIDSGDGLSQSPYSGDLGDSDGIRNRRDRKAVGSLPQSGNSGRRYSEDEVLEEETTLGGIELRKRISNPVAAAGITDGEMDEKERIELHNLPSRGKRCGLSIRVLLVVCS